MGRKTPLPRRSVAHFYSGAHNGQIGSSFSAVLTLFARRLPEVLA
jgi:hypothetical protein